MNESRRKILQMLSAGQITPDEAERLIAALEKEQPGSPGGPGSSPKVRPKYLRVVVESNEDDGSDGSKVNVRVPMQLLRAGVKLASLIPAQARDRVNEALRKDGLPFDLSQIKPENLEELIDQLDDVTVDVGHKNHKARVMLFCE
ncbi:MAG: hypothetical protein DMG59_27020 [Acidobacteria bacterium]|jgi:hypothetical protein|nr:MAG: hypothetical protein DMG59_27020 [Acidobacteriota bacterium]